MTENLSNVERVLQWYRVYCLVNALLHLFLVGLCIWAILVRRTIATEFIPEWWILLAASALGSVWLFFGLVNLKLMSTPRTKAWWTTNLINIILGVSACLFAPICLYLLINWFSPGVKRFFGVNGVNRA